jgi:hypothetical protein
MRLWALAACMAAPWNDAAGEDPAPSDALAVLRGVANARTNIPPTRCRLRRVYKGLGDFEVKSEWVVEFDGPRRRYQFLDASKQCIVFDGSRIMYYAGEDNIALHSMSKPMGEFFPDPRNLGITTSYPPDWSPEQSLLLHDLASIELIEDAGDSLVQGGHWHCRVVDSYGEQHDFWVRRTPDFPVTRYEYRYKREYRESVSEYANAAALPLPSRVETRRHRDGQLLSFQTVELFDVEVGVSVDPKTWTLAGLEVPIGTAVVDIEAKRRVGYWDGEGVSEDYPTPAALRARVAERQRASVRTWLIGVNALAFGLVVLVWTLRRTVFSRSAPP